MTPTLEDVTRLTDLRVHEVALSRRTYIDCRPMMESYLDFSPKGTGPIRGVGKSEFFSVVGLFRLHRGLDESITSFCTRVVRQLRCTLATFEGPLADLDLRCFLFLL